MPDPNTSITITNELNVPDTNDDTPTVTSFNVNDVVHDSDDNDNDDDDDVVQKQQSQLPPLASIPTLSSHHQPQQHQSNEAKSADRERRIPPHLRRDTKSQSLLNIPSKALPLARAASDEIPSVTVTTASAQSKRHYPADTAPPRVSSATFPSEHHDTGHLKESRQISASTNEFKLSANRQRIHPTAYTNGNDDSDVDDGENDDQVTPQLRIRSSIVSLFGRIGRLRRPSSFSTNSNSVNDVSGAGGATGTTDNSSSLRALPQIAAAKILRAFSYVGKS